MLEKSDAKNLFAIKITAEKMNEILLGNAKVDLCISDGSRSNSVKLSLAPIKVSVPNDDEMETKIDSH